MTEMELAWKEAHSTLDEYVPSAWHLIGSIDRGGYRYTFYETGVKTDESKKPPIYRYRYKSKKIG